MKQTHISYEERFKALTGVDRTSITEIVEKRAAAYLPERPSREAIASKPIGPRVKRPITEDYSHLADTPTHERQRRQWKDLPQDARRTRAGWKKDGAKARRNAKLRHGGENQNV